jgi:hypothetical protein
LGIVKFNIKKGIIMYSRLRVSIITLVMVLGGCATGTRHVDILPLDYPDEPSSEGQIFIGSIVDRRRFEESPRDPSTPSVDGILSETSKETLSTLIGRQRGGFGAALGDVALPKGGTVQEEVRELLIEGLGSRGYKISDDEKSPIKLNVDIDQFWGWFTPGMFTVSVEAIIICRLDFAERDGNRIFIIRGYGIDRTALALNESWRLAYQRAYSDFLSNLDKTLDEAGL